MRPPSYEFRKVTRADYPMLARWLAEPHIGGWWGAPEEEIALIDEDIDDGPTDMRIVCHEGRPFAYVQDWDAHFENAPHYAHLPPGTRGIDTFLGEPSMLGQGHASAYLRQRALALLAAGCPNVAVDPDPGNLRAIHAYRAAGFRGDAILPCEDGDPVLVMEFRPD
jgi:aminoglycoside 6'-N-acetyltransferase